MRSVLVFLSFLNPVSWFIEKEVYQPQQCQLEAWVRAQDLQPNATSLGEVRVKLIPPCDASISSLNLELRLEETMRDDRILGPTTRSLEELLRTAWATTLDLMTPGDMPPEHSFLDGVVFPFNIVTPNVNYPVGTNVAFSAKSLQNHNDLFNTHVHYLYKVTAGLTDGSSREAKAGWTTFHPCRSEALDTSPTKIQTVAKSLSRIWELWDEDVPRREKRFAGTVNVTVSFPNGAVVEQGGLLELDVSLSDARDMELPAVQVAVLPSLLQNINLSSPKHASLFTIRGESRPQELRATIRPPFPKPTLGQSLPPSANLWLPQQTDLGPVPPELSKARFLIRADEILPGGFRGMWGTPSAVVYLRLEVGPENNSKRHLIDNGYAVAFCDSESGWEVRSCWDNPNSHDVVIFEAEVPVSVAHRTCPADTEPPIHYLENNGSNQRPALFRSHANLAEFDLPLASPQLETQFKKLFKDYDPNMTGCAFIEDHEYVSDVEMHFAGMLWERSRLIGEPRPKPRRNFTETDSYLPHINPDEDYE